MFKFIKLLFFTLLVTVGLYFFGDFTINGVNVRDYLQEKITLERLRRAKDQTVHAYKTVDTLVREINMDENAEEVMQSSRPIREKAEALRRTEAAPMDEISQKDKEKLRDLLEKNQ